MKRKLCQVSKLMESLPRKGDSPESCQRQNLINALGSVKKELMVFLKKT